MLANIKRTGLGCISGLNAMMNTDLEFKILKIRYTSRKLQTLSVACIPAPIPCSCRVPIMAPVHTNTKHHHQQVPPPEHHQQLQHQNTTPVHNWTPLPAASGHIHQKKIPYGKKLHTFSPEQCLENINKWPALQYLCTQTPASKHGQHTPSHATQNILKMHYWVNDIFIILY